MRLTRQTRLLRRLGLLTVAFLFCPCLAASDELRDERYLATIDEIVVEQNATIVMVKDTCASVIEDSHSSNFSLPPEVCLSGYSPPNNLQLLHMPSCFGRDGSLRLPVLVTYSDANCTGESLVHHSTGIGPSPGWWIRFPFEYTPRIVKHWSLIFHCHSEPFEEVADPFKWAYTNGGELQPPLKDQVPLPLCEHRPPRLTDGRVRMNFKGCGSEPWESWKLYDLPIDVCQSTREAETLKLMRSGTCLDGSRPRWARYWDDECKDLHDINEITDEDFVWNACQLLDYKKRRVESVAFYCDGPDARTVDGNVAIETAMGKQMALIKPPPKQPSRHVPLPTPLPRKPWLVPFWKGLVLVDRPASCPRDDRYTNPMFQELDSDSCFSILSESPIQIFQVPRCFNLTRASIAFFTWPFCRGSPVIHDGTDEGLLDTSFCMSIGNGYSSMAFRCEDTKPLSEQDPHKHRLLD